MDKKRVNIYDSDFIPFYVCYNKKGDEPKTLQRCIEICDDFINNINRYTKADHYIGYLTKGKCFRYTINPEYKANRKYTNVPDFTMEVRQHMIDNHHFIWQEGYEADDLVVSYKAQHPDYDCIIVSPDKDILKLAGKHFNPRQMKYVKTSTEEADKYFWSSMIVGDRIDGILGIPGRGPAYASKVIGDGILLHMTNVIRSRVLDSYILNLGEYKGIQEFTKNYLSLKLVDNVLLNDIKLNDVNKMLSEQTTRDRGEQEEPQ